MAEESESHGNRMMNFVSEEQLQELKKKRGERVEDGTAQRDRPLHEILKQNKEQKDAEFKERFKHRPPKALDDDEIEFIENLKRSKREYERRIADEEEQQIASFRAAVKAAKLSSSIDNYSVSVVSENADHDQLKETSTWSTSTLGTIGKRKLGPTRWNDMIVKLQPKQEKKAKIDQETSLEVVKTPRGGDRTDKSGGVIANKKRGLVSIVSYSDDESEDDK